MPEDGAFVQCYRGLIGTMRLSPEHSAEQLTEILDRVSLLLQAAGDSSISGRRSNP